MSLLRDATLKQLRSLAATVEAGTVTGAAQRLHVTPPAVTQQLQLLERSVGAPLYDRIPEGLRPTAVGAQLLSAITRIESELAACAKNVELLRSGKVGSVTFGAVSTAKYWAPQVVAAFWKENPNIDVKLTVGNRDETIQKLRSNSLDVAIMGRPPLDLELDTAIIGAHPHVVIASPSHPLARRRRVSQKSLADHRFVTREQGSGTRLLSDWLFSEAGIEPKISMEISSNETIKQAVIADLGLAFISAHTVAAEIDDGRLAVVQVEGLPIMRRWYAVHPASFQLNRAGQLFWEFLVDRGPNYLPRGFEDPLAAPTRSKISN